MTIIADQFTFLVRVGRCLYVFSQDWVSSLMNYRRLIMGGIFIFTVLDLKEGLIGLLKLKKIRGSPITEGKNGSDTKMNIAW